MTYGSIRAAFTEAVKLRHADRAKISAGLAGALLSRTATRLPPCPTLAASTQLACPLL